MYIPKLGDGVFLTFHGSPEEVDHIDILCGFVGSVEGGEQMGWFASSNPIHCIVRRVYNEEYDLNDRKMIGLSMEGLHGPEYWNWPLDMVRPFIPELKTSDLFK